MTRRKILIACYEVPGWGGASTAAYALFEMLQAEGVGVELVNIIGEHDKAYFRFLFAHDMGNPRGLSGVQNCVLKGNNYQYHANLHGLISQANPDVILGIGWIAAYLAKKADPARKLIYLTTGCGWMGIYTELGRRNSLQTVTRRELANPRAITGRDALEEETVDLSDLVVAHSDVNLELYQTLYSGHAGKMYKSAVWFSEWICRETSRFADLSKPFDDRAIDVLFVANDWYRPVKGFWLIEKMVKRLNGLICHIVGELPTLPSGFHDHGFLADRRTLFKLMGDSKVVVSPSTFDAAPGILFEAAEMGCNVVASRNCGNWELCHADLLATPDDPAAFSHCIRLGTERPYPARLSLFSQQKSYDDLKNLLMIF